MRKIISGSKILLSYRGAEGQWSYIFHRLTGVGVLVFLAFHIADTALLGWGPQVFNRVMALYRHPFFRISEIFLFAAVLFHALNGLRIIAVDFWPASTRHHKRLFWIEMVLFFLIMGPVAVRMILPILKGPAQ